MNIPIKLIKNQSNSFNDNFNFVQSLAKKYNKSIGKKKITETSYLLESFSSENPYTSSNFKEDVIYWLFSLSEKDRFRACSVENKWLTSMLTQMYNKYRQDRKLKFQLKYEFMNEDELYFNQFIALPNQTSYNYNPTLDQHLDTYFNSKVDNQYEKVYYLENNKESFLTESLFLSEVVIFSLKENNDSFGISPDMLSDKKSFIYNFEKYSKGGLFSNICTVNYDQTMKYYTWNFPEWFKNKDYNSICELIVAYIEQIICVRYWYHRENIQDNSFKHINNFITLTDDPVYNELIENKNKIVDYLKEFSDKSIFKSKKIDLQAIISETRNDPNIISKVPKGSYEKNSSLLFAYRHYNDIYDGYCDLETEMEVRLSNYLESSEKKLINCSLFISIDKVNSIEDFVLKKIYNLLLNMYADKNALDLIENIEGTNKKDLKKKKKKTSKNKSVTKKGKKNHANIEIEFDKEVPSGLKKTEVMKNNFIVQSDNRKNSNFNDCILEINDGIYSLPICAENISSNISSGGINSKSLDSPKRRSLTFFSAKSSNEYIEIQSNRNSKILDNAEIKYKPFNFVDSMISNILKGVITSFEVPKKINQLEIPITKIEKVINKDKFKLFKQASMNFTNEKAPIKKRSFSLKMNSNNHSYIASQLEKKKEEHTIQNTETVEITNIAISKKESEGGLDKRKKEKKGLFLYSTNTQKEKKPKRKKKQEPKLIEYISESTNTPIQNHIKIESTNHQIIKSYKEILCEVDLKRKTVEAASQTEQKENTISTTSEFIEKTTERKATVKDFLKESIICRETSENITSSFKLKSGVFDDNIEKKDEEDDITEDYFDELDIQYGNSCGINSYNKMILFNESNDTQENSLIKKKKKEKESIYQAHFQYSNSHNQNNTSQISNNSSVQQTTTIKKYPKKYPNTVSNTSQNNYNHTTNQNHNSNTPQPNKFYNSKQVPSTKGDIEVITSTAKENPNKHKKTFKYQNFYYQNYNNFNYNNNFNMGFNNNFVNMKNNIPTKNRYFNQGYPSKDSFYNMNSSYGSSFKKSDNSILKKINIDENAPSTFCQLLHNNIVDYSNQVNSILSELKETKNFVVELIQLALKLSTDQEFENDIYGSYATDLSIESSDVDMLIKMNECVDLDSLITKICIFFVGMKCFETITPITTATIPVIKLVIDPMKIENIKNNELREFIEKNITVTNKFKAFLESSTYNDYMYDKSDLNTIKIDISFVNDIVYNENVVDYIKSQVSYSPEITPLTHVLKRYLSMKRLNSCFNGGLASYSLLLMIILYTRYPKTSSITNLGSMLIGFLEFFGKSFNFKMFVIDLNNFSPILMTNEYSEGPVIIDPITRKNVAKNSFRIEDVKEAFGMAFDFIQNIKLIFDKSSVKTLKENIIMELHLKS